MKLVAKLLAGTLAVAAVVLGAHVGYRAGFAEAYHRFVGIGDHDERHSYALRYAAGLEQFQSLMGQDLWVLHAVFPGVTDGFFVDLGSANGVDISNTWALERKGWTGICIDPFPRNMAERTCQVFAEAVDSEGGRTIQFQNPGAEGGGLLSYAGWWVSDDDKRNTVEVTTTTLADILARAGAPPFIHYMNVDIEGAEYEALRVFPFDRYKIGAITIEHNNLEDRRALIRDLLTHNGYRLEWAIRDQDWYMPDESADPERYARALRP
jgi:FkbM family methyltransferase